MRTHLQFATRGGSRHNFAGLNIHFGVFERRCSTARAQNAASWAWVSGHRAVCMPMVTATRADKVQVVIAAIISFVVGIFVVTPLAHLTRGWLRLPKPTALPIDGRVDRLFIATYWVPWLLAWAVLLVPGIAFMIPVRPTGLARRTRSRWERRPA